MHRRRKQLDKPGTLATTADSSACVADRKAAASGESSRHQPNSDPMPMRPSPLTYTFSHAVSCHVFWSWADMTRPAAAMPLVEFNTSWFLWVFWVARKGAFLFVWVPGRLLNCSHIQTRFISFTLYSYPKPKGASWIFWIWLIKIYHTRYNKSKI